MQTEIINPQTTLSKEVAAEGINENKGRSPREDSSGNTTPRRETRGVGTENTFDQSTQAGTTSQADKRCRIGDTGAMNTTPLSAIQEVLLNKKEGKKSKFTVELEEREENEKSRVRIDIREADEKTLENDGMIIQPVHAQTRDSSTPKGTVIERDQQYPSPILRSGKICVHVTGPLKIKPRQTTGPGKNLIVLHQFAIVT